MEDTNLSTYSFLDVKNPYILIEFSVFKDYFNIENNYPVIKHYDIPLLYLIEVIVENDNIETYLNKAKQYIPYTEIDNELELELEILYQMFFICFQGVFNEFPAYLAGKDHLKYVGIKGNLLCLQMKSI